MNKFGNKVIYRLNSLIEGLTIKRKKCGKCGKLKDVSNFYNNKQSKDFYNTYCKDCMKTTFKNLYEKRKNSIKIESAKDVEKYFTYNNGKLYWKRDNYSSKKGDRAGYESNGYLMVNVSGKPFYIHRLVWLMFNDCLPEKGLEIDHINRNRQDNRIENLRVLNHNYNIVNSDVRKNNKTGIAGVKMNENGVYKVSGNVNNRCKHIGTFTKFVDAVAARFLFEKENGYHDVCETSAYKYFKNLSRKVIELKGEI